MFLILVTLLSSSRKASAQKTRDLVGLSLNLIVHYCSSVFPLFHVTFFLYLGVDPITQFYLNIIAKILPNPHFLMYLTSRTISFILFCTAILEASRFLSCVIVINTIGGHLMVDCILQLDAIFAQRLLQFKGVLLRYEMLQIIVQSTHEVTSAAIILCMLTGFLCGVGCNFVTLKFYDKLPISIYLMIFTVSVFILIITKLMLTLTIDVYEKGKVLRGKWMRKLGEVRTIKYFKRKLASVRAVSLYGGLIGFNVYKLEQGVKPRYHFEIANYTITLCLSVPLLG